MHPLKVSKPVPARFLPCLRGVCSVWRRSIVLVAGLAAGAALFALETDPVVVDESPAITVGQQSFSQYFLDKNYNQFAAQVRGKHGRAPVQEESHQWFQLFLAKVVIKAQLEEEGFLQRPDIQESVRRMERHILTQPDGLFYQSLYKDKPLSPEELQAIYRTASRAFDAVIVRFDEPPSANAMNDVGPLLTEARARSADVQDGRIIWPYHPFQEVSAELLAAEHGKLVGPLRKGLGFYYLMVREESLQKMPDYAGISSALERHVHDLDHLMIRKLRRKALLDECAVHWEQAALTPLQLALVALPEGAQTITPESIAWFAGQTVAKYSVDGQLREISTGAYASHFNQRLMRQMPRTQGELMASLQDMMVEEHDFLAARKAGLDRQPKFVQDRRNFALNQALQAFENEKLVPGLQISAEELGAYYERHRAKYEQPEEVAGRLYHFASADDAVAARQQLGEPNAAGSGNFPGKDVLLRQDGASPLEGIANQVLMQLADDTVFGPVPAGSGFAVFLKQATTKRATPSLEKIAPMVRSELIRIKLDDLELKLARQREALSPVAVYIDYAKYGISAPPDRRERTGATITFLSEK